MIHLLNKRLYRGSRGTFIGRPSVLGNPFRLGYDGNREQVLEKYKQYLWNEIKGKTQVYEELLKLAATARKSDLFLECFCFPRSCHGMIIRDAINWINSQDTLA